MQRLLTGFVLVLVAYIPAHGQGPAARVADLTWLTGRYAGETGGGSLEENWGPAASGSIAAVVRSTSGGSTDMVELIVIEEEGGSLTLRLKQWDPGMKPRGEGFQTMELVEVGEMKVSSKSTGAGGMIDQLTYSRDADQFTISIKTAQGGFDIPLVRQSAH